MSAKYIALLEAQFRKPVLMYHGTSNAVLKSILVNGVQPFPKKRAWDVDRDAGQDHPSRASVGGSYWAENFMTAYTSWHKAKETLGGTNRLIIAADIQQQSAYADEDDITFSLRRAFEALRRHLGVIGIMYAAPFFFPGPRWNEKVMETAIGVFVDAFMDDIKKDHPNPRYRLSNTKALEIIRSNIRREIAYTSHRETLSRMNIDQDAFNAPDRREAEDEFLKLRGDLTRTFNHSVYSKANEAPRQTLRIEHVVGYRGANKIRCIIEKVDFPFHERDQSYIILHYGTIPEDLKAQYRSAVGVWPEVRDPAGNVLEPARPNPNQP